ncbi:Major facilitator superfamily domain general substrate transporter [Penicillium capsulatum]|nr:Major facilitator superfamily domain general substrate transporter [Penicillium capsulatum]
MEDEQGAQVSTDTSGTDLESGQDRPTEKIPPEDPYLVEWNGPDDPELPMNYPLWKKSLITCIFSTLTIWVTFSSSVFSAASTVTSQEFHVSVEVTTLGTSLTVLVSEPRHLPGISPAEMKH